MGLHVKELRSAIDTIIDHINAFDVGGKFNIPLVQWLPLGNRRPRADVMNQLQDIVLSL